MISFLRLVDYLIGNFFCLFRKFNKKKKIYKGFPKKILLIKLWGLGNLVVIWPLICKIRKKYPYSYLIFLTFDMNEEFIKEHSDIDKIIYFKFTFNILKILHNIFSLIKILRRERIDVLINFETVNSTASFLSFLIKPKFSIGINNRNEKIFYDYWVENKLDIHISKLFNSLLFPLGINSNYEYFCFPPSSKIAKVEKLLKRKNVTKFICIHPFTSKSFKKKEMNLRYISKLVELITKKSKFFVVFGGTEIERNIIECKIIKNIKSSSSRILNFAGLLNIWEYIELIRKCYIFISNDTGPMHLAASLGKNIVVFYGPTSPLRYKPLNKNVLIFYKNLPCSPCIGRKYISFCRKNICLDFSPDFIFEKIYKKFLQDAS